MIATLDPERYELVAKAISFLVDNAERRPNLTKIAAHVGLSEFHLHRVFVEWAGVSPKEFLQALTLEKAKEVLAARPSLQTATFDLGLTSSSRLHDLFVTLEAVSPGEFMREGEGLGITWALQETAYGSLLVAKTDRGICRLSFLERGEEAQEELGRLWPKGRFDHSPDDLKEVGAEIARRMEGHEPGMTLGLRLTGSELRLKVWQALIRIPSGSLATYGDVATAIGRPTAVRAVASCLADNPIAYLIPCHRVIRSTGAFGEYEWGKERKLAMIGRELLAAS